MKVTVTIKHWQDASASYDNFRKFGCTWSRPRNCPVAMAVNESLQLKGVRAYPDKIIDEHDNEWSIDVNAKKLIDAFDVYGVWPFEKDLVEIELTEKE